MKHHNSNGQQKKQEGRLQFFWKFAAAAVSIMVMVLSVGCSGQRGGADNIEVEEATEGTEVETAEEPEQEPDWMESYLNSLRTGKLNKGKKILPINELDSFVIAYIDDDDIPELFFDYHGDPALLWYDPDDGFRSTYFGRNEGL